MFPKSLPRSAVRKIIHTERMRRELSVVEEQKVEKASLKGMPEENSREKQRERNGDDDG